MKRISYFSLLCCVLMVLFDNQAVIGQAIESPTQASINLDELSFNELKVWLERQREISALQSTQQQLLDSAWQSPIGALQSFHFDEEWRMGGFKVIDLDGDTTREWIVRLHSPSESQHYVVVINQTGIVYEIMTDEPDIRFELGDMTADGRDDLLIKVRHRINNVEHNLHSYGVLSGHSEIIAEALPFPHTVMSNRLGNLSAEIDSSGLLIDNYRSGVTCSSINYREQWQWLDDQFVLTNLIAEPSGQRSQLFLMAVLAYEQGDLAIAKRLFNRVVTDQRLVTESSFAPCTLQTHMVGFATFRIILIEMVEGNIKRAKSWVNWLKKADVPAEYAEWATLLLDSGTSLKQKCTKIGVRLLDKHPQPEARVFSAEAVDITALCDLPTNSIDVPYRFSKINLPDHVLAPTVAKSEIYPLEPFEYEQTIFRNTPQSTVPLDSFDLANAQSHNEVAQWIAAQRSAGSSLAYVVAALSVHFVIHEEINTEAAYHGIHLQYFEIRLKDLTGDGNEEWIVKLRTLNLPTVTDETLHIVETDGALFTFNPQTEFDYQAPAIEEIDFADVTGDGRDDAFIRMRMPANHSDFYLYTMITGHDGDVRLGMETVRGKPISAKLEEVTYDSVMDITIQSHHPGVTWICRMNYPRTVYSWVDGKMKPTYQTEQSAWSKAVLFRQANDAFRSGQTGRALDLYMQTVYRNDIPTSHHEFACYFPQYLEQFTAFRIALIGAQLGEDNVRQMGEARLKKYFPEDAFTEALRWLPHGKQDEDKVGRSCHLINTSLKESPQFENFYFGGDDIQPYSVCQL